MPSELQRTRELTVVAAVIRDDDGRVLLTRRPDHKHMGGLWEFPGGKVARGESPEQALCRELEEELGLGVEIQRPLTFAVHRENGLRILLLFFQARVTSGEPRGREGQDLRWIEVGDLSSFPTPPADADLVRRLENGEFG